MHLPIFGWSNKEKWIIQEQFKLKIILRDKRRPLKSKIPGKYLQITRKK